MDTTNDFLVSMRGEAIIIMLAPRVPITKEEALRLAAYLVAMADDKNEFPEILKAVQNT